MDGAVAGVVLLSAAAGLEELAELAGVEGELDDDPQPAASATQISPAATWAVGRGYPAATRVPVTRTLEDWKHSRASHLVAPHTPSVKV